MSGGKGGSSSTEIPEWLKEPLLRNITRAEAIQSQEFTPYQGPEVAAFSPMQIQAMRNVGSAAEAFGMMPMGQGEQYVNAGINAPQTFAGGIRGYSSMPLYEEAQAKTAATPEGQANLEIRKALYSPEVKAANLARFKEKATGGVSTGSGATGSNANGMQQQYQDNQNYQSIVNQYTDDDNNVTDWDAVNREYKRKYG